MENYEIIKGYLKSFPSDTTAGELLGNMETAEKLFDENLEKQKTRMEEYIGHCYYYADDEDIEDRVRPMRWFYQVTGLQPLYKDGKLNRYLFNCNIVEVTEDTVYFMDNSTLTEEDMEVAMEILVDCYNKVKEYADIIRNFKPTFC